MVVRHDRHPRSPNDVQDCQGLGAIKRLDTGALRLAEPGEDAGGIGDGACHQFPGSPVARILRHCATAIFDKAIEVKHLKLPLRGYSARGYSAACNAASERCPFWWK